MRRRLLTPDLQGGFWVLAAVLLACSFPASGQERRGERTASWYADRPAVLRDITEACRDDPGRLRNSPDCINAAQARVIVAERMARASAGTPRNEHERNRGNMLPPTSREYWTTRPQERAQQIAQCNRAPVERMPPTSLMPRICAAARSGS
ncbi:hypothetical protein GCM10009416_11490 [Craurococcus roseus]|uniref:Uncharacterized protein n=1 Tax=Craurococcus roseus TaxID=77585 RepID=A0ABN1EV86_9PROT